ncbi:hypothetical protein [Deinococcus aerophilus]|nr:hypothetical protein [Deinococcus aerophilus]
MIATPESVLPAGESHYAYVSAANTIQIVLVNATAAPINNLGQKWYV